MNQDDPGAHERKLAELFWREGDEQAFRALYRLHTPLLYRIAYRFLGGNADAASDVVQDTWIRAVKKLGSFRWESCLSTWLVGIAINRCREELRRSNRDRGGGSKEAEVAASHGSLAVAVDLELAIAQLPTGYREVLVLHDIEGYTHEEIGQLLGIDASSVTSSRVRSRLRGKK